MDKEKNVWLTWHYQARSRNLAKIFNLKLYEYFRNKNLFERHLFSFFWAIKILFKVRPKIVFIQYSFLLLLIVAVYKKIRFKKVLLVVDCHTKALRRRATGVFASLFWRLKTWSFNAADLTIISNEGLIRDISELHNNFVILPDKISEERIEKLKSKKEKYCVYISSFQIDEPFEEVLKASELLKNKLKFYWTGKCPTKVKEVKNNFPNVKFTDYLSFPDYYNLIGNADCLLALTTEDDCLQSGAYEALNMEVPFVISNKKALQSYFQNAAIYTSHNPSDIAEAIENAISNRDIIKHNILKIKSLRNKEFDEISAKIKNIMDAQTKRLKASF